MSLGKARVGQQSEERESMANGSPNNEVSLDWRHVPEHGKEKLVKGENLLDGSGERED